MLILIRFFERSIFFFCLIALLLALPVSAQDSNGAFTEKWIDQAGFEEIKQGGFVLYMRHGITDNSRDDVSPIVNYQDCDAQRILSEEGKRQAVKIGMMLKKAKIPIVQILHSPLCRARETAELAFPHMLKLLQANTFLASSSNLTAMEKVPQMRGIRQLLGMPVSEHHNRLLISHAPNLYDLMGYFVKPEGTIVVFRPQGGENFVYVGSLTPRMLEQLLK